MNLCPHGLVGGAVLDELAIDRLRTTLSAGPRDATIKEGRFGCTPANAGDLKVPKSIAAHWSSVRNKALRAASTRSKRSTGILVGAVTLLIVLITPLAIFLPGNRGLNIRLLDGGAWLQSVGKGALHHMNLSSGKIDYRLDDVGNEDLEVVNVGGTAVVRRRGAGKASTIDLTGARAKLRDPVLVDDSSFFVVGGNAAWLVNPTRQDAAVFDPKTLQVGVPVSLGGSPSPSAGVDKEGVLWVAVAEKGEVVPVLNDKPTPRKGEPARYGEPGTAADVTVSSGLPYVVNRAARTISRLEKGRLGPPIPVPGGLLIAPDQGDTAGGVLAAVDPSRSDLVLVDPRRGTTDRRAIPAAAGRRLQAPVAAGSKFVVPDFATGEVIIFDAQSQAVEIRKIADGPFSVETKDGAVVANDRASNRALVVNRQGTVKGVDKYQPVPSSTDTSQRPSLQASGPSPERSPLPRPARATAQSNKPPVLVAPRGPKSPPPTPPTTLAAGPTFAPPGAPSGVNVKEADGELRVIFGLAPNNGDLVTKYRVVAQPGGQAIETESPGQVTLKPLSNGVLYSITVSAANRAGWGQPSEAKTGMPRGLPRVTLQAVTVTGDAYIRVQFSVDGRGAKPTRCVAVAEPGLQKEGSCGGPIDIAGLRNSTQYKVYVYAESPAGRGESDQQTATTPGVSLHHYVRFFRNDGGFDDFDVVLSTSANAPGGYQREGTLARIETSQLPGTVPLVEYSGNICYATRAGGRYCVLRHRYSIRGAHWVRPGDYPASGTVGYVYPPGGSLPSGATAVHRTWNGHDALDWTIGPPRAGWTDQEVDFYVR